MVPLRLAALQTQILFLDTFVCVPCVNKLTPKLRQVLPQLFVVPVDGIELASVVRHRGGNRVLQFAFRRRVNRGPAPFVVRGSRE